MGFEQSMTRGRQRTARPESLLIWLLVGWVVAGCSRGVPYTSAVTSTPPTVRTAVLEGQPIADMLPQLDPSAAEFLEFFMSTVPAHLPKTAYPSWMAINPRVSSPYSGTVIPAAPNGIMSLEVGIGNPGSLTNEPNLVCLRNAVQVACTPDVDVWQLHLPPYTLALAPTQFAASPGDLLTYLSMAEDEATRIDFGSHMFWAYVDHTPGAPNMSVDAPTHAQVLGGCNFVALTTDPESAVSPGNMFYNKITPRGTILYLLIQLCEPTSNEYVQLALVADRRWVANPDTVYWRQPLHLVGPATVIALDTAQLGSINEFQVAVVPLTDVAAKAFAHTFTQAITLSN